MGTAMLMNQAARWLQSQVGCLHAPACGPREERAFNFPTTPPQGDHVLSYLNHPAPWLSV